MAFYLSGPVTTGTGAVCDGDATVTSAARFGGMDVGSLVAFDYTGSGYQGMWGIVQTYTSSSAITMDRAIPYSGTVNFRFATTANKFPLDTINSMRFNITSPFDIRGMCQQNSRSTLTMDLNGCVRTITVSGTFEGTTNNVTTWLDSISEKLNGQQFSQNPYLLCVPHLMWNSGNGAWYLVAVKDFSWDYFKPNGTGAHYTLVCVERQ